MGDCGDRGCGASEARTRRRRRHRERRPGRQQRRCAPSSCRSSAPLPRALCTPTCPRAPAAAIDSNQAVLERQSEGTSSVIRRPLGIGQSSGGGSDVITHLRLLIDRTRHVGGAAEDHHHPLIRLVIERAEVTTARRAEQRHLSRSEAGWALEGTNKIEGGGAHLRQLGGFRAEVGCGGDEVTEPAGERATCERCTTRAESALSAIGIAWRSYLS